MKTSNEKSLAILQHLATSPMKLTANQIAKYYNEWALQNGYEDNLTKAAVEKWLIGTKNGQIVLKQASRPKSEKEAVKKAIDNINTAISLIDALQSDTKFKRYESAIHKLIQSRDRLLTTQFEGEQHRYEITKSN